MKKLRAANFTLLAGILLLHSCGITSNASSPTSEAVSATRTPPPPTQTTAPTYTFTASPTATPIPHPLSIDAMRAREYPGSDAVIETTLDPGVNYNRYIVS